MVTIIEEARSVPTPPDVSDEDYEDGWGPVRPRRSSMPASVLADAPNDGTERLDETADDAASPLKT
jgi:hypothetical protein